MIKDATANNDPSAGGNFAGINCGTHCQIVGTAETTPMQTRLLLPFVTNQNGFDTGITIANSTSDPFGTTTQSGACTFS